MFKHPTEMDRLEQDLRFFRRALDEERDQFTRNLILGQIRDVQQEIVNLLREERRRVERENQNLQEALNSAMAMKKK